MKDVEVLAVELWSLERLKVKVEIIDLHVLLDHLLDYFDVHDEDYTGDSDQVK